MGHMEHSVGQYEGGRGGSSGAPEYSISPDTTIEGLRAQYGIAADLDGDALIRALVEYAEKNNAWRPDLYLIAYGKMTTGAHLGSMRIAVSYHICEKQNEPERLFGVLQQFYKYGHEAD